MLSFMDHCGAPALCVSCANVVVADLMDAELRCPDCHGHVVAYDDASLRAGGAGEEAESDIAWALPDGRSFALDAEGNYRCPRCRAMTLTFVARGYVD
jgi:DNA-directed RNA polymerase subunit RPC12/RpoP